MCQVGKQWSKVRRVPKTKPITAYKVAARGLNGSSIFTPMHNTYITAESGRFVYIIYRVGEAYTADALVTPEGKHGFWAARTLRGARAITNRERRGTILRVQLWGAVTTSPAQRDVDGTFPGGIRASHMRVMGVCTNRRPQSGRRRPGGPRS